MFIVFFFVSIYDFVNLKNVFRISSLFFEIIRFIQNFEQIIFTFVFVFNFVFNLKFEISLSIFNVIDVYKEEIQKKTIEHLFRKKTKNCNFRNIYSFRQ